MGWTPIANLAGPQGAVGPQGLPGIGSAPADTAVAGYVAGPSLTNTAIQANFGNHIMLVGAGIDATGATDSTTAIQTIITANPGRRFLLPAGFYKISSLTLAKGQHLAGAGQHAWRDRTSVFNSAGYAVNANFTGTVIRCTLVSGTCLTLVDSEVNSGGFSDFTLIGPGSGSAIGIAIGNSSISVVNPLVRSVMVCNFPTGIQTQNMNEGSFYDFILRGCTLGFDANLNTIQNAFYMLDIQWCGDGIHLGTTAVSNAFYSTIGQSNSGIACTVAGLKNVFYNPYWENNTTRALDILPTAQATVVRDPFNNGASDTIRIQAGATDTVVTGYGGYGTSVAITNAGTGTYLQGRFLALTDTGTHTVVVDPELAGSAFGSWKAYTPTVSGSGITQGASVTAGRYTIDGKQLSGIITYTLGSGFAMAGIPSFTLPPFAPITAPGGAPASVILFHTGVNWFNAMAYITLAGAAFVGYANFTTGAMTAFTATVPFTWTVGDVVTVSFSYEIA